MVYSTTLSVCIFYTIDSMNGEHGSKRTKPNYLGKKCRSVSLKTTDCPCTDLGPTPDLSGNKFSD